MGGEVGAAACAEVGGVGAAAGAEGGGVGAAAGVEGGGVAAASWTVSPLCNVSGGLSIT